MIQYLRNTQNWKDGLKTMKEYVAMWKNCVNFEDRTIVRGFWMAVLFNNIVAFILTMLMAISDVFVIPCVLYSLTSLIPVIAICIRRLHDLDKSGYWLFFVLAPFGLIPLLVWFCSGSVYEGNRFGTTRV